MSVVTNTLLDDKVFSTFIKRHPLISYFVLAYGLMWLAISPMVVDALEIANLPDVISLLAYILSSLLGPTVAAFWITGVLEGKAGMRLLLRRAFQFRAGWQWYVVILFVPLMIWFGAYSLLYDGAPLMGLISNPSLLLFIFLPNLLIGLLIPSIGEEPGWRGFALPRACSSSLVQYWVRPFSVCCGLCGTFPVTWVDGWEHSTRLHSLP